MHNRAMPSSKKKSISGPGAVIPVRALDFVMYNAKDVKKTRAFYQKFFGFQPGEEWEEFWTEFATEPLTLCLNAPDPSRGPEWDWRGAACVALAVDDVPSAVEKCREHGVKVLIEPVETSVCWMAWIADPDGNRVCLHSRKNGTAG
jgi:predicted enzyme related to lactoylglutathione lyase